MSRPKLLIAPIILTILVAAAAIAYASSDTAAPKTAQELLAEPLVLIDPTAPATSVKLDLDANINGEITSLQAEAVANPDGDWKAGLYLPVNQGISLRVDALRVDDRVYAGFMDQWVEIPVNKLGSLGEMKSESPTPKKERQPLALPASLDTLIDEMKASPVREVEVDGEARWRLEGEVEGERVATAVKELARDPLLTERCLELFAPDRCDVIASYDDWSAVEDLKASITLDVDPETRRIIELVMRLQPREAITLTARLTTEAESEPLKLQAPNDTLDTKELIAMAGALLSPGLDPLGKVGN